MATDQKLEWILTEYGKNRITELLSNPEDKIRISFMNIGSDNTGTPQEREGEHPAKGDGKLKNQVNPIKIPIFEKGISSERENTIYFKALIDETMCGYDISELAIYEEINGYERMFAVGVGQPIAKPDLRYGYLMAIEYTLFIESTNLLDVYDRIVLNPNNEFLKEADIDSLYRTILYVEGNLAEQISHNTHILGLNRAQELDNLISATQLRYNAATVSTYYSSLINSIDDLSKILGFWSFHYTDNQGIKRNIKDFSSYNNYLSTNALLSSYPQEYLGVLSSLNFQDKDYFYLDPVESVFRTSENIELGKLKDHTMVGSMIYYPDYNGWSFQGHTYTEEYVKENIIEYYLRATDASTTSETITLTTSAEKIDEVFNPKGLLFGNKCYAPHTWTYNQNSLKWVNEISQVYDEISFKTNVISYTGAPANGDTIITSISDTATPQRNETVKFTGKQFDLIKHVTKKGKDTVEDSPFTFIASLQHNKMGERNTLLAQSNYFTEKHNFEITKTENNSISVKLFSGDSEHYIEFETLSNAVPSTVYNIVIVYSPELNIFDEIDPVVNIYINNKACKVTKTVQGYTGMTENLMETGCYISDLVDGSNTKTYPINAKVCLMALVKEALDPSISRCNSLILNSLSGKNIYYRV